MTKRLNALAPLALALALAACKQTVPLAPSAQAPVENPIQRAIDRLDQGDEAGARRALAPLVKRDPANPEAAVLTASITQDPVALLGPKSFAYPVVPGDTMLGLSERFLGTRLKFYELARYNGIKVPSALAPGTVIRIPGEAPRVQPAPEPAAPKPAAAKPTRKPKPQPAPPAAGAAPVPAPAAARPAADPAAAMRLRGGALAALNQGKADQAVALLRRAAALAPGNPLIARDLARAERIANTVRARR